MIQNIKCCACALRRECRRCQDQEDEPAYISLKGQICTEMEWACLSRGWALNPQVLLLEVGIRHRHLFPPFLKPLGIPWDLYIRLTDLQENYVLCVLTDNKQWNLTLPSYHTAVLWSYFNLLKKGEMSWNPEILMKYLSHSTSTAVAAWEFTNSGQSSTSAPLLAGPWVFPYRSHYCFQLNDKWES